jgi:capsular exopolysaccharide synthesis family protein
MTTALQAVTFAPPNNEGIPGNTIAPETGFARDALRLLRRRKFMFALAFILPSLLGVMIALVLPPVYTASSTVLIETTGKDVVTLKEVLADVPADAEAIAGEIEILSSRELLERTATTLSLVDDPEFNPTLHTSPVHALSATIKARLHGWLQGFVGPRPAAEPRPLNDVTDALRRHLLIAPVGRSRAIRITSMSHDPRTAAAIVNTLAGLYTEEHLRLRNAATQEANDWIGARITDLRTRADQAVAAVEQYRAQHGLVRGRDSLLVQQQLTETSTQLTQAQSRRSQAEATLAEAERALASGEPQRIGTVLNSPLIQQLRQQEAQLAARRANLASRLGDAHPDVLAATAQLRDVEAQLRAETSRITQSLRDAARVARADEAALAAHMNEARQQVDQASSLDVGLQQLQREADVDNALYQTFLTRSKETEPQFNFPTINVRVLSRAVPSDHPVSPNRLLIALSGIVLGILAGVAAAVGRDLVGKGLRSRADVERLIGLAPIGVIPFCHRRAHPIEQMRLQEAVAALWARVSTSVGGAAPKSVVISSAVMREGKTTLARLLGIVVAHQGQRVLIIDADLRCSSLTAQTRRRGTTVLGLADVIRGTADLAAVTIAEGRNVHILPAGDCNGSPVRLLASPGFTKVMREAERAYDLVIVDSPPVLIGADAWLLGRVAGATILVARWERTPQAVIEAALRQFLDVGVRCVGVVLSIVDVNKFALYDDAASLSVSWRARRYYANLVARK